MLQTALFSYSIGQRPIFNKAIQTSAFVQLWRGHIQAEGGLKLLVDKTCHVLMFKE